MLNLGRLNKVGLLFGSVSASATLIVALIVYTNAKTTHGESAWLFMYPLLWNMPSSMIVTTLHKIFRLPDWLLVSLMVLVAWIQWYFIGKLIFRLFQKKKTLIVK